MLGGHHTAEYPAQLVSKTDGRTTIVWTLRPGCDIHWLDRIVVAAVAASITGCKLANVEGEHLARRTSRRITSADLPQRRRFR